LKNAGGFQNPAAFFIFSNANGGGAKPGVEGGVFT
jgi:hypothetical protein